MFAVATRLWTIAANGPQVLDKMRVMMTMRTQTSKIFSRRQATLCGIIISLSRIAVKCSQFGDEEVRGRAAEVDRGKLLPQRLRRRLIEPEKTAVARAIGGLRSNGLIALCT
jgi:hypothetical protein